MVRLQRRGLLREQTDSGRGGAESAQGSSETPTPHESEKRCNEKEEAFYAITTPNTICNELVFSVFCLTLTLCTSSICEVTFPGCLS